VTGGIIEGSLFARGSSSLIVAGGSAGGIAGIDTAYAAVYAPTEATTVTGFGDSVIEVFGGSFSQRINALVSSTVTLVDGTFEGTSGVGNKSCLFHTTAKTTSDK